MVFDKTGAVATGMGADVVFSSCAIETKNRKRIPTYDNQLLFCP